MAFSYYFRKDFRLKCGRVPGSAQQQVYASCISKKVLVPNQKYGNICILVLITIKLFKKTRETSLVELAFPIFSENCGTREASLVELAFPIFSENCGKQTYYFLC